MSFNKNVSELDLAECAFLAGINHAPNAYNPFNKEKDNTEKIEKRTKNKRGGGPAGPPPSPAPSPSMYGRITDTKEE